MHQFSELIDRSSSFALDALREAEDRAIAELQNTAGTSLVKTLQMVRLHKIIVAVGMFSIFEAQLQDRVKVKDGFELARSCLHAAGESDLKKQFTYYVAAINTLKHGDGRSYRSLLAEIDKLPFRVKKADENFFFEGDVSEVSTLIDVDDQFILQCAHIIRAVSVVVAKAYPDSYL